MEAATLLWHALAGVVIAISLWFALLKNQENQELKDVLIPFLTGSEAMNEGKQKVMFVRAARVFGKLLSAAKSRSIVVSLSEDLLRDDVNCRRCAATLLALCDDRGAGHSSTAKFVLQTESKNWTDVQKFLDSDSSPLRIHCEVGMDKVCAFSITQVSRRHSA